jgi:hypothetical protein
MTALPATHNSSDLSPSASYALQDVLLIKTLQRLTKLELERSTGGSSHADLDLSPCSGLRELGITSCPGLREVAGLSSLLLLTALRLDSSTRLPGLLGCSSLRDLAVCGSDQLSCLSSLRGFTALDIAGVGFLDEHHLHGALLRLSLDSCSMSELSALCHLSSLQSLHVERCDQLTSLPSLSSTTSLAVKRCNAMQQVQLTGSLRVLVVESCAALTAIYGLGQPQAESAVPVVAVALAKVQILGCAELQLPCLRHLPQLQWCCFDCPESLTVRWDRSSAADDCPAAQHRQCAATKRKGRISATVGMAQLADVRWLVLVVLFRYLYLGGGDTLMMAYTLLFSSLCLCLITFLGRQ